MARSIFNYEKFTEKVSDDMDSFKSRSPYPFAYYDGLFDDHILKRVNEEIDCRDFEIDGRKIEGEEIKVRSDFEDNESLPEYTKKIFEVMNGGKFLNIVSSLTGIDGLIPDPYYDGGGINMIENGGTLAVHVDGTHNHRMNVCRRINAILFLNENWDVNWNGYHEQWIYKNKSLSPFNEHQEWRCVRKILPKMNRLFVFITNDHSWHGHAGVLSVPEGVQRRSLIAYYYTVDRPSSDLLFDVPHRALFINNSITLKDSLLSDNVEIIL